MNGGFFLIHRREAPGAVAAFHDDIINPTFRYPCELTPASEIESRPSSSLISREVEWVASKLVGRLARDQWELGLRIHSNVEEHVTYHEGWGGAVPVSKVVSVNLELEGELLSHLHSLLLYNVNRGQLKLKLVAHLEAVMEAEKPFITETKIEAQLLPRMITPEEGLSSNHGKYIALDIPLMSRTCRTSGVKTFLDLERIFKWRVSFVSVLLQGSRLNLDDKMMAHSQSMTLNRNLLESGLKCDMEIQGKDNVSVLCHQSILISKVPAVAAAIEAMDHSDYVILPKMSQVPRDTINAFLAYVYYGDMTKPLESPEVAIYLHRMGYHGGIPGLEEATREILLTKPASWYSSQEARNLYKVGKKMRRAELRMKARHVLAILGTTEQAKPSKRQLPHPIQKPKPGRDFNLRRRK